jgi:hypothetical protein
MVAPISADAKALSFVQLAAFPTATQTAAAEKNKDENLTIMVMNFVE